MRELKFRAWHKIFRNYAHIKRIWLDGDGDDHDEIFAVSDAETTYSIHEIVLEQYTGIKDKNGKEIYEGDILQDESNDAAVVIWREHQAEWGIKWIHMGIEDSLSHRMEWGHLNEIIGNIHENPELLEHKG